METYRVLEKALALIEDERNWGQVVRESKSGRLCAIGAVELVVHGAVSGLNGNPMGGYCAYDLGGEFGLDEVALNRKPELRRETYPTSHFNDTHSHAEVVALFQTAIRAEKAKAGIHLPTDPNYSPESDTKARENSQADAVGPQGEVVA